MLEPMLLPLPTQTRLDYPLRQLISPLHVEGTPREIWMRSLRPYSGRRHGDTTMVCFRPALASATFDQSPSPSLVASQLQDWLWRARPASRGDECSGAHLSSWKHVFVIDAGPALTMAATAMRDDRAWEAHP